MSLGGGFSTASNNAVERMYTAGVVVTTAAGYVRCRQLPQLELSGTLVSNHLLSNLPSACPKKMERIDLLVGPFILLFTRFTVT